MRFAVIDACRPVAKQIGLGMGARYLLWELQRHNTDIAPLSQADIILVSVVDARQFTVVRSLRRRFQAATIIVGGAGAINPYILGKYADMVCIGDGQAVMDRLCEKGIAAVSEMPNVWIDRQDRPVEINNNFPWNMPPMVAEDGAVRVWCGRGCRKLCRFCATGWGYAYKENPNPDLLLKQVRRLIDGGYRVNYVSNDIGQHSFARRLPKVDHLSLSVSFIRQNGLPGARQIRLGIEGISERLRSAVGKPLTTDDLVGLTAWLNRAGRSVRWFLIAGLPGECDQDWQELRETISKWKRITDKGVLALSFTAFLPEPATPLAIFPLEDDYWGHYSHFRQQFFDGRYWSHRIKLMHPAQPKTRLKNAMAYMGLREAELRAGGDWGPNNRVKYPYKKYRDSLAKSYKNAIQARGV